VIPAIGHLPVEAVDPARIQHWIDTMRRDGLGPRMIGNCTRVVGSAYRQAILLQIVRTNPVAGTKRPSIRQPAIQTWTDTEMTGFRNPQYIGAFAPLQPSPDAHDAYGLTHT